MSREPHPLVSSTHGWQHAQQPHEADAGGRSLAGSLPCCGLTWTRDHLPMVDFQPTMECITHAFSCNHAAQRVSPNKDFFQRTMGRTGATDLIKVSEASMETTRPEHVTASYV